MTLEKLGNGKNGTQNFFSKYFRNFSLKVFVKKNFIIFYDNLTESTSLN